jgi:hypothetical protein
MLTKEIRKGDRFVLNNGWYATMKDNGRGTTRIAEVEGFYTEIGSVYSYDILAVQTPTGWEAVVHTDKELKLKSFVDSVL